MGSTTNLRTSLVIAVFLMAMACTAAGKTILVDCNAPGPVYDGSSWPTAFKYLQDGLSAAVYGDEIRVAQGIYKPDRGGGNTPSNRTATFQLMSGVAIYGGFPSGGGVWEGRDQNAYETILSGDLNGDDVDVAEPGDLRYEPTRAENSYRVVTGSGTDATAVLDGFIITAGNANGSGALGFGGGMYNSFGNPTIVNCTLNSNATDKYGGGMYNDNSSPTLTNCSISENSAYYYGGGMYNNSGSLTLTNCTFSGNSAQYGSGGGGGGGVPGGGGGGMYNNSGSLTLTNCTFSGNSTGTYGLGGGICNMSSSTNVTNCIFTGNSSFRGGGIYNYESGLLMTNCIVSGNKARRGGGMYLTAGYPKPGGCYVEQTCNVTLISCTLAENQAEDGRTLACSSCNGPSKVQISNCILWNGPEEIRNYDGSTIKITYSDVWGGWPGEGNIDSDPCFVQPGYFGPVSYWKFDENSGTTAYDSIGFNHGTVYGAQWTSGQVGSALNFDGMNDYVDIPYDSSLDIDASEGITLSVWIKLNSYPDSLNQGPIFGLYVSTGIGTKNYLAIMKSTYGNVIAWDQWPNTPYGWIESIRPDLDTWYYVTVVEDSSYRAIYINGSLDASDNTPESYEGNPPDTIRIGCRADNWAPCYFDGAIDEFAIYDRVLSADEIQEHYQNGSSNQDYPDVNTPDYHLLPGSPCINAGDPNYVAEPNETDLDGNPRIIGGRIDMGVYEFNHTPVADAGPDRTVEAQAPWGATVTLDGSGSSDADSTPGTNDDINDFNWYELDPCEPNADVFLGSGRILDCNLSIGEHIIVLEVIDRIGAFDTKEVTITVQDTTPPDFEFSVTPTMLWPPNHKMVLITPSWTVSDECDATPQVSLVGIVANEGDDIIGDGHTSDDIQIGDDGSIYVRAERSGPGSDRIYTITYQSVDDCGNTTVRSATVSIPHDFRVLARIAAR
ncbi:MAG: LamG-like jellyroll fold domain-containing protein, partial [Sedimentisphaerales bacterium]